MEDHLAGQPESSVALYRQFVRLVEACGPFSYAVSKTSITFKGTRRGFAGARPDATGPTRLPRPAARRRGSAHHATSRRTRSACSCTTSGSARPRRWTPSSPAGSARLTRSAPANTSPLRPGAAAGCRRIPSRSCRRPAGAVDSTATGLPNAVAGSASPAHWPRCCVTLPHAQVRDHGCTGQRQGHPGQAAGSDFDLVHISVGDIFRWNVQRHTKLAAQVRRTVAAGRAGGRRPGRGRRPGATGPSTTGTTASSSTASRAAARRRSSSWRATTSTA